MATMDVTESLALFRGFDQRWPEFNGRFWPSMDGRPQRYLGGSRTAGFGIGVFGGRQKYSRQKAQYARRNSKDGNG